MTDRRESSQPHSSPEVVLFGAADCHLCDEAKAVLELCAADPEFPTFRWRVVEIDGKTELEERYRSEIPVIEINREKRFRFRLDPARFRRFLEAARDQ